MDSKEGNTSSEVKTSALIKPTASIAQTMSSAQLKVMELIEYCRIAETNLKEFETKIQLLKSSKCEKAQLKVEYVNRNKICSTNSDSLLQAKNELYKYKCELKAEYIAEEKALKTKRLNYKKIISSYESEWLKNLEQYNSNPIVIELSSLQQENNQLEKEAAKLEQLISSTKTQFLDLTLSVQQKFQRKMVEFAKEMVSYKTLLDSHRLKQKKQEEKRETCIQSEFNFSRTNIPVFEIKNSFSLDDNERGVNLYSIDTSIFDDLLIPMENLETQNEEELFPFLQNDPKPTNPDEELLGGNLENSEKSPPSEIQSKATDDCFEVNQQKQGNSQSTRMSGNESQYFQSHTSRYLEQQGMQSDNVQTSECWSPNQEQELQIENNERGIKNSERDESSKHLKSSREEEYRTVMETAAGSSITDNEENLSDGSFENQYGSTLQNKQIISGEYDEKFENHYRNISSASSEEISTVLSAEATSESGGSPIQPPADDQTRNAIPKPEAEKGSFKSFSGFFTMDDDQDSPKPSIFKLF